MKKMTPLYFISFYYRFLLLFFTNLGSMHCRQPPTRKSWAIRKNSSLSYTNCHPRSADNIDNLNRSAEYIKESLSVAVPELPRRMSPLRVALQKHCCWLWSCRWTADYYWCHYDSASSYENDQLTYTPGAEITPAVWQDYSNWHVCYISKSENWRAAGRLCVGRAALLS